MNRAEAKIRSYQNSITQLNPTKDMCVRNSGIFLFAEHSKAMSDGMSLARKMGRKKRRRK